MKIRDTFILHDSGDETMLVPTGNAGFSGLVRGNKTLGLILKMLQQDVTEEEIISGICEKFAVSRGIVERDVRKTLAELRRIGAIDE